ncbi:hypothetical protein STENM327S_06254 [Streptomyces tendae]
MTYRWNQSSASASVSSGRPRKTRVRSRRCVTKSTSPAEKRAHCWSVISRQRTRASSADPYPASSPSATRWARMPSRSAVV